MPANKYLIALNDLLEQRFSGTDQKLTNSQWLAKNTTLRGKPFDTAKYPFQQALIDDDNVRSCCIKPSQVGVSELYQRVALAILRRNPHRKGIYAYPDDLMRQKNVQTRMHPMLLQPIFTQEGEAKPIRSIELIQLGSSFLYMTGSKVGDATSTDADFVFLDEFDLHDMAIAALFKSRMLNSDWKIERTFSTPTYEGFGIHGRYMASDQTLYMIKCDHCNHWQFPMFTPDFVQVDGLPNNVGDLLTVTQDVAESLQLDIQNSFFCCQKCRARLDLGRRDNRAWVSKHPSRTEYLKGWKVNPASTSTRPPRDLFRDLWDYLKAGNIRGFKNSSLGEPHDAGSNRLTEADIRACLGSLLIPAIDRNIPTWVGVDMGHTCHIVVGQGYNPKAVRVVRAIKVPIKELAGKIQELMNTYRVFGAACDRHPESAKAEELREMTNGILIPCEYRGQKELNLVKSPENQEILYAQVNRTGLLDVAARQIRMKEIVFEGYEGNGEEIVNNYRNMVREESPEKEATWVKLDPADHFFHATGFMNMAMRIKEFAENVDGPKGSVIAVAGVSMGGYTPGLIGNQSSRNNPWQQALTSRRL